MSLAKQNKPWKAFNRAKAADVKRGLQIFSSICFIHSANGEVTQTILTADGN
jgi:hypothetical protein